LIASDISARASGAGLCFGTRFDQRMKNLSGSHFLSRSVQ
jgi:hypothetical protein